MTISNKSVNFADLHNRGIKWVEECLKNGEALAKLILAKNKLSEGEVYLAAATKEHKEAATNNHSLSQGSSNKSAINTEIQLEMLLRKLLELQKKNGPLLIIGEDNLRYPSDKKKNLPNIPCFQFNDRYLYFRQLSDIKNYYDFDVLTQSSGYPLNAFVLPKIEISKNEIINDKKAERIASTVLAIINSAYDGETYTLWVKSV